MVLKSKTKRFVRGGLALLTGIGLVIGGAVAAPQAAVAAEPTAMLGIKKKASVSQVKPGEAFAYTVEISCSTVTALGCVDAKLADEVPAEFEIVSATVSNATPKVATIDGQRVSVDFDAPLGDGTAGLVSNATATVTITVKLREGLNHELSGIAIENTANVTATNAGPDSSAAVVTPVIPAQLATTASKRFDPATGQAKPGTRTTLTLSGTNESNGGIDALTLTDPASPEAGGGPFEYLQIVGVSGIDWPEGASEAKLEYWNGTAWVAGEVLAHPAVPNAPPAGDAGVRVTFTGADGKTLPAGVTGGLTLDLEQRAGVAALEESTTVANTVSSTVALDKASSMSLASANYGIVTAPISVAATKEFEFEDSLIPGSSMTVNLGAENTSASGLDHLSIREPATGDLDPNLEFKGFVGNVEFPSSADLAAINYTYLDENGVKQTGWDMLFRGDPYPTLLQPGQTLLNFEITYTGNSIGAPSIQAGAAVKVLFLVEVSKDTPKGHVFDNKIDVAGWISGQQDESATDTAQATAPVEELKIVMEATKSVIPSTIWGYKHEPVTVLLTSSLHKDSTTNAKTVTVADPELGEDGKPVQSDWWELFRPTSINRTDVPVDSELTVFYFSKAQNDWVELVKGAGGSALSHSIPEAIRDDMGGLKFEYEHTGAGFAPGSASFAPNFGAELKEALKPAPEGKDITVANCAGAVGEGLVASEQKQACDDTEILAPIPGEHDFLDKKWTAPSDGLVTARSGEHASSRLKWSTGGISGVTSMTLTDTSADSNGAPAGPVANTTFNAFDLFAISPITAEMDPYLQYDSITAVELYNGAAWVKAANASTPYTGSLPEILLTSQERASTTGVRLIFEENKAVRGPGAAPGTPALGSGVARSMRNDRAVDLKWQVRDTKRSDGTPVLGNVTHNTDAKGEVLNRASAVGVTAHGTYRDDESDSIVILDRPLVVSATKGWSGGPLGVPPAGTNEADYPSGRVTVTATNGSVAKVDQLQIIDAKPGGADPFDTFNLKKIVSVTDPQGADAAKTLVLLKLNDGSYIHNPMMPGVTGVSPSYAKSLSAADLKNVVQIEVHYEGRIASGGKGSVQFDLQLRATKRSDATPVTTASSPVKNEAVGAVEDLGGVQDIHRVEATASAQIALQTLNIAVKTTKSFNPATQFADVLPGEVGYDEEDWEPITMTLSAQPSGSARPAKIVVTDDTVTFWNAYRFVGFGDDKGAFKLTAPIAKVKVDALVGGDFVATENAVPDPETGLTSSLELQGAHWEEGVAAAAPALPSGVLPEDVQGLRFTFTNADGTQWENPANPKQLVPLQVKRRAYLESPSPTNGSPIPVPSNGRAAAPGEAGDVKGKGGRATNTVHAEVTSFVNNPENKPLTASHSTTAQAFYEAGETKVRVSKTPLGAQTPGQVIPFKLEARNTADSGQGEEFAILDPVIIDTIDIDPDGNALLVFDPESTDPKYGYELKAGAPPKDGSTAMPTAPSKVKVTVAATGPDGHPTKLKFSFPKDTVLMPGDVYTITINMMFRPGVKAGQRVSNTIGISAAEPFAVCNGVEYRGADDGFETCEDDTTVYPVEAGALRGQKFVKADDTKLGVINAANPAASNKCAPTLDDFYNGDCVPVTAPFGTETWRERVQNTGTLDMPKVVTIDRLPTPGDQGALALLPRGSQWQPGWVGPIEPVSGAGHRTPDSVEYFYSNAENPCTADLFPNSDACPAGAWHVLNSSVDPAEVKHIKTVFNFTSQPFAPGDVLGYTFKTRTPVAASVTEPNSVAWNTIAIGAETITENGAGRSEVLPTEGRRVGVALATGPLRVEKLVTGDGAGFAPTEFKLQVECTVPGPGTGETTKLDPILIDKPIVAGKPVLLDEQFPLGAMCQVVDQPGVNGETSSTASDPVEIKQEGQEVALSTLENVYDLGDFTVTKLVEGAIDQDGEAIDYGSFELEAACTFLGSPVVLLAPKASLKAGESWSIDGLPVGAECTVTETDARGATPSLTGGTVTAIGDNAWQFTIAKAPVEMNLELTNTFELGAIAIEKKVTGDGAAALSPDTVFTFDVLCTLETDDGNGRSEVKTVWEGQRTLTKSQADASPAERITIDTLPKGATCTVSETGTAGATEATLTPDTSTTAQAVGTVDAPVVFEAVNRFDAGQVIVEKELAGEGAALWGNAAFTVTLACWTSDLDPTSDEPNIVIPGGATRELQAPDALTATYADLPLDAICAIEETETGGATKSEFLDAVGEPIAMPFRFQVGDPILLPLRNTFDVGAIDVTKEVTGTGAAAAANKVFEVELSCRVSGADEPIKIPGGAKRELSVASGLTTRYEQLPAGAECELIETETGGATAVTIIPNAGDPTVGTATVEAGESLALSVENSFIAPPIIDPDGDDGLPTTGGSSPLPWLLGAGALLVVGAVLIALRSRKRGVDDAAGSGTADEEEPKTD